MTSGVLLMSFGAVESVDDVGQYYTNIRGGKAPAPAELLDLRRRYERIGGRSPLVDITRRQARALQAYLLRAGHDVQVEIGMRHWRPTVRDAVRNLVERGVRHIVGITSGPYDSNVSVASYERLLAAAVRDVDPTLEFRLVRQWHDAPGLDQAWKVQFDTATAEAGWSDGTCHVLFSAHSLPQRVMPLGDPYPGQFLNHAFRLARHLRLRSWGACYQSAGMTKEPWLGPDILDALRALGDAGHRRVLSLPIGFCADHLEILHDLDVEARQAAAQLGIDWRRAPMPNDSEAFVEALANAVVPELTLSGMTLGATPHA